MLSAKRSETVEERARKRINLYWEAPGTTHNRNRASAQGPSQHLSKCDATCYELLRRTLPRERAPVRPPGRGGPDG